MVAEKLEEYLGDHGKGLINDATLLELLGVKTGGDLYKVWKDADGVMDDNVYLKLKEYLEENGAVDAAALEVLSSLTRVPGEDEVYFYRDPRFRRELVNACGPAVDSCCYGNYAFRWDKYDDVLNANALNVCGCEWVPIHMSARFSADGSISFSYYNGGAGGSYSQYQAFQRVVTMYTNQFIETFGLIVKQNAQSAPIQDMKR